MANITADQALRLALEHRHAGRVQDAEGVLSSLLQMHPKHPEGNHLSGLLALQRRDLTASLQYFKAALEARPDQGNYWLSYVDALILAGEIAAARSVLEQGLKAGLRGAPVDALTLKLGLTSEAGAEPAKEQVAALGALFSAGKYAEAIAQAELMTGRYPSYGLGWKILATILKQVGRTGEALQHMQKAALLSPNDVEAHFNLGAIHQELGQLRESVESYRRALVLKPSLLEAQFNLGFVLQELGQYAKAAACYREVLKSKPANSDAHCNLGLVLQGMGQYDEALIHYRRAIKIKPDHAAAHNNLGSALHDLGQVRDAIASFRRALALKPDFHEARSNLLIGYNFLPAAQSAEAFAEALQFGVQASINVRPYATWPNQRTPDRCLRIGLVSGDLRSHSVGHFLLGLLNELASSAAGRLECFAYYNHVVVDEMTLKIKACCSVWHSVGALSDEALAHLIRDDAIDILIDLSGHTGSTRLPMFAWKPAPIQASWLGYVATTGLAAMDYYIADRFAVPESQEAQFLEKVWRLPEIMNCFTPPQFPLPASPTPALVNGYITFGSFNNLTKVNDEVVALWSKVIDSVPNSKLLINTRQLNSAGTREATWRRFAAHGIARERVMLEYITPRASSIAAYSRVDIALDPFPYNGGTTTAEALWMGVPVLTLCGDRLAGRMGVSQLSNVGLHNWIAEDEAAYVEKAKILSDLERLAVLRDGLRQQARESPLFDAKRFAGHFEQALRAVWVRWLELH